MASSNALILAILRPLSIEEKKINCLVSNFLRKHFASNFNICQGWIRMDIFIPIALNALESFVENSIPSDIELMKKNVSFIV